jgi:hypothetical protein
MKLPLLFALLWACAWNSALAQPVGSPAPSAAPLVCVVCTKPLVGKYFIHNQTNHICIECEKLPTRCAVCGVPVKDVGLKTTDGRRFCRVDAPNVVVAQEEAGKLFAQARSDLTSLSDGALDLRNPDVAMQLVDVDYWNSKAGGDGTNTMHRLGFSISRPIGGGFAHNVILMSGQLRNTTLSTCAHELTHLWLNENLKPDRKLDPDTREALCELIAFKLAARRADTNELTRIKQNTYTKGVILNAIEFDSRVGLPGVITWVRTGTESALPGAIGNSVTNEAPSAPIELRPPAPPATKLELRSLIRTATRTVAVINGERFVTGAELSMLIDGKRRLVRLESASESSVVVTVDGIRQSLDLGAK